MKFPVDLLAHVSQEELERSAQNYMNTLLYSNPDFPESLTLPDSTEVVINISTVGFVPLYGSSDKQKILALFSGPTDPFTAVALYLLNRWWTIRDILKTEDNNRDGAVEVQTVAERIVLYSLNRVIYRAKEMSSEELPFLCHGETDYAKILWHNGEAVGFYSVKPSGSLCSSFSTRCYQLPVMDSIFVRKSHRGNDYGLQMLSDYVLSFNDSCLGLRYPLTTAMYKVCQKYLSQYPGDADLLWEVQSVGGPNQRTNIANKIQVMDLSAVSKRLIYTEEPVVIMEERESEKDAITTMIKEADTVKCTVQILEEVTVVRATKEADEVPVPVAAWDRNNGSKQWKIGENITEDKTEKVIRIEDIEAESPGEEQVFEQQITEQHNISEQVHNEDMLSTATEGKTQVEYEEDSASMLDKATTVQASEDLESESTVAPVAEERQVEDSDLCGMNALCDSQIAIENVVSELEEAQKKDSTVVSKEVLDVCKEAEMVEMECGAKNEACEEDLPKKVTQQVKGRSAHATPAKEKAGKDVVKTVHNEPPRLRSHRKEEEGRVLRGRTVVGSIASKGKSTQRSQKAGEKLETEFSLAKEVDEPSETEGQYGRDPTAVPEEKDIVTDINKTDDEQKNEETEKSLIDDEAKESDEEKEPPVVQRRALRARSKATPPHKSRRQSKRLQKQQNEHTDDLESQESVREEKIEQQVQENQMEKEDTINKPEVTLKSTEENMDECQEVQEEGKTQELVDTEAVVEEGKEEEELGVVIADVTEKCDSVAEALIADEAQNLLSVVSTDTTEEVTKENAENSDIPELHQAAVMLVDMKTASHQPQVTNTEEIQAIEDNTAAEKEEIVLTTAEASEEESPTSMVEQKELEPQQGEKVVEEEAREGDSGKDMENDREFEEKQCLLSETSADKEEDCTAQNAPQTTPLAKDDEGTSLDEEEVPPLVQTRTLRSGKITIIDIAEQNIIRKTEDGHSEAEKTDIKTEGKAEEETVEVCLEPVVESCQEKGVTDEANLEQNVAEQLSEATTEIVEDKAVDVSGEVLQGGEDVGEEIMTASEKEENAADLTTATEDSNGETPENQNETAADSTLVKTNEEEKIVTVEEQQSDIVALQLPDLPRLSVVLVDLKKSQHGVQAEADAELAQEETTVEISVPGSFAVVIETRQGLKEEEASVVKTQDLCDVETAKVDDDEDMEEEKSTEEDEPAKETRRLRERGRSTSATPRRKSKRVRTQHQIEEKLESKEAEQSEYVQVEETQDKQGGNMEQKEEIEISTNEKEDNKESEVDTETVENIVEESVPEQDASKDTVKDTVDVESLDNIQTNEQAAEEEDASAAETTALENDQQTTKAAQDEKEEEEEDSDEGKPVIETRVLRSGKKCAATVSRRISKRTCTQSQNEEEDVEEGTPIEKMQLEETILKETQEETIEDSEEADPATQKEDNKESETEMEKEAVEETPAPQSVEDLPITEESKTVNKEDFPDTEEDKSTEEDEPAKETRVLRGGRKSAPATPRRKSKRARKQPQREEKEETEEAAPSENIQTEESIVEETQDNQEEKTEDRSKDETEEDDVEEGTPPSEKIQLEEAISKETQEETIEDSEEAGPATQKEDNKESETEMEKEAEETQDNQEEKTEDRSMDEITTQKEDDGESETEEAVATSVLKEDQIEGEDETNEGENILIKMTDTEMSKEKGDDLNLELVTDEEAESLSQEEEDEQIVIRGKVLRGRSVPSIIITPKNRRHSAKVQKAQESSSDEDPEQKPKRSSQKRQSSEITPNRRSKRHRI